MKPSLKNVMAAKKAWRTIKKRYNPKFELALTFLEREIDAVVKSLEVK